MVAEDFLRTPVRQWLDGVEPTWTLLTFRGAGPGQATAEPVKCVASDRPQTGPGPAAPTDRRPRAAAAGVIQPGRACLLWLPARSNPTPAPRAEWSTQTLQNKEFHDAS